MKSKLLIPLLIFSFWCTTVVRGDSGAARVHILLAMDTHAKNIEYIISADSKFLTPLLKLIEKTDSRVSVELLTGEDVTPARIRNYFTNLDTNSNDAICVVYSGHGAMGQDAQHYLAMKHGWMSRAEIQRLIRAKQPRLGVLFSSSCAGSGGVSEKVIRIDKSQLQEPDRIRRETFDALFFQSTGFVDLNSSRPGIVSWGTDRGTLGIHAFAQTLAAPLDSIDTLRPDGFVHWDEATEYLQSSAARATGVKDAPSLSGFQLDVQVASPMSKHAPDPMPGWRIGIEVNTHWSGTGVSIRSVTPNSPAAEAGLQEFDRIITVDGNQIRNSWFDLSRTIREADDDVTLEIERIIQLGDRAQVAKSRQLRMTLPVLFDTKMRRFVDRGETQPTINVARYLRQLYFVDYREDFNDWMDFSRGSVNSLNGFAWLCITSQQHTHNHLSAVWKPWLSVKASRAACQASGWKAPELIATLAAAYAASNEFPNAVAYQKHALKLANKEDKREYERRMRLYESGNAYREPF